MRRATASGVIGGTADFHLSLELNRKVREREAIERKAQRDADDLRSLRCGVVGLVSLEQLRKEWAEGPQLPSAPQAVPVEAAAFVLPVAMRPVLRVLPDLVYVRKAPQRDDELVGNRHGRDSLNRLIRTAHTRAGRTVGQAMIVVMGPSGVGKSHSILLELRRRYHVVSNSSLDFWGRKEGSRETYDPNRRHLDEFLREQASSHTSDGRALAVVLEEADELFAACPKALDLKCGAVIVATLGANASSGEPEVYKMFKKLRDAAELSHRLVRFYRPDREDSKRALLRLAPHMPPSIQRSILDEATGDFRQLAIVEELFRQRQAVQKGALAQEVFQTPFEQAKDVLARGHLPRQLDDTDYATCLVVTNFASCCGATLADLEAMAAVAEEACLTDVRITAAYRGNDNACVPEVTRSANEIVLLRAIQKRPWDLRGDLVKVPDAQVMRPERHGGYSTLGVVSVEALPGAVEAPSGLLPLSMFRKATRPRGDCIYYLNHDQATPLHERSWLGGWLYEAATPGSHHCFPVPGRTYRKEAYTLDEHGKAVEGTLRYDLDFPGISQSLDTAVCVDPRFASESELTRGTPEAWSGSARRPRTSGAGSTGRRRS